MTVIAWDGTTLAVDSLSISSGLTGTATKLHAIEHGPFRGLVTGCGYSRNIAAMRHWFERGLDGADFPDLGDERNEATLVTVDWRGRVCEYTGSPYAIEESTVPYAWGSGDALAIGAMEMGATAVEAVEVACRRSSECGGAILFARPDEGVIRRTDDA